MRSPLGILVLALGVAFSASAEDAPAAPKLTRPPKVKKFVPPIYPESARAAARTATVTLALDINAQGKVTAATATSTPDPEFDKAAVAAALQLEFEPAEIDNQPAPVRIAFRYKFTVQVEEPVKPRTVTFRGKVIDRASGEPIPQVRVELRAADKTGVTAADGTFGFEGLAPGVFTVRLGAKGFVSTVEELTITTDAPMTLRLDRSRKTRGVDEEIVIRVPKIRRDVGAAAMTTADARNIPGVMGDALAVVQNLPGVARASAGSGEVVVWGSAPAETRIYVDDVPVPYLYHRGGLRSIVNDSLVASVELVPGGYGAEYGRATGGLVKVVTSPIPKEGFSGYVGADLIDGSASVSYRQRAADGPNSVAIGGRYGWLDKLLPLVVKDIKQTIPLPQYFDYIGKWIHRGSQGTTQLLSFGGGDQVERFFARAGSEKVETWFHRVALRHEKSLIGGGTVQAGIWAGLDKSLLRSSYGTVTTSLKSNSLRAGGRANLRQTINPYLAINLGADVEASQVKTERAGTLGLPAREGDIVVFGQPPGDQIAFEQWTTHAIGLAGFAEAELSLGEKVTITPGVRLEPFVLEGDRKLPRSGASVDVGYSRFELYAEPRLSAQIRFSQALSLSASTGLYHQPPDAADLSAVFGNTSLPSSSGVHAVLGAVVKPWKELTIEGTGFYKSAQGLAARSPLESPAIAQALLGTGEGRSFGGQVVVKPGIKRRLSGWASYSLIQSERRSAPEAAWRLFDYDQTHLVVVVASFEFPWEIRLGARARVSTGYPRTPITGASFDARTDTYQPIRGAHNGDRLPTFFQLDGRLEKAGKLGPLSWSAYLDVINITNQQNPEEVTYSYDYSERKYLTGLPVLAVLGARIEL